MSKVVSHLRRLRLEYAARRGTPVSLQEVVDTTGISRNRMTSLELGKFDRVANDELMTLSAYYTQALGRAIAISDILEIVANANEEQDQVAVAPS